jgi:actin-related protein
VECCYKETNTTQEVENVDKVDKEKVEEESNIALVEVQFVDDTEDVEEEPAKAPPQQAKPQEIAATKKSLRLQDQNALATANKKAKLDAQKIAGNRKKTRVGASEYFFEGEERKGGGRIKDCKESCTREGSSEERVLFFLD